MRRLLFMVPFMAAQLFGDLPRGPTEAEITYHAWVYDDVWGYRQFCEQAAENDEVFNNFKRAPQYTAILEHLGVCTGRPYLNIVKEQTPEFLNIIDQFKKNDLYGNPRTNYYDETGDISSTTIRYMKVASDLTTLFGSLDGKSIVEIGGGYGGQCFVLSCIYKFKDYTLIDLPEPLALAKKFLEKQGVYNVIYKPYDEALKDGSFDLLISNYAYAECSQPMREKYLREVFPYAKKGYITGELFQEEIYKCISPLGYTLEMLSEKPLTGPNKMILIWQ